MILVYTRVSVSPMYVGEEGAGEAADLHARELLNPNPQRPVHEIAPLGVQHSNRIARPAATVDQGTAVVGVERDGQRAAGLVVDVQHKPGEVVHGLDLAEEAPVPARTYLFRLMGHVGERRERRCVA